MVCVERISYTRNGDQNFFLVFLKKLKNFLEKCLTNGDPGGNITERVSEIAQRTAMMREIAAEPVTSAEYVRSSGG